MDVTPTEKMFRAMSNMVDACCGEAPPPVDHSTGAIQRRNKRAMMMELLHGLVAISMREGVNRAVREAQERKAGPQDAADRDAIAKATEDAHAGVNKTYLPGMDSVGKH